MSEPTESSEPTAETNQEVWLSPPNYRLTIGKRLQDARLTHIKTGTQIAFQEVHVHVTVEGSWMEIVLPRAPQIDIEIAGSMEDTRIFDMDGMEHSATPGLVCSCHSLHGVPCTNPDCSGLMHYQPVYGGQYYRCDVCGKEK